MHTKIILMYFCFVSNLQRDSIFDTFHFAAIQRGVKFLLAVTVSIIQFTQTQNNTYPVIFRGEIDILKKKNYSDKSSKSTKLSEISKSNSDDNNSS